MSDRSAVAHTSYLDCSEVFCDRIDGGSYSVHGDWAVVISSLPFAALNFIVPVPSRASTAGLPEAHEHMLGTGLPHAIVIRSDIDSHLVGAVSGLGYTEADHVPAMVAVDTPLPRWPSELERVDGLDARENHIEVLMAAFGLPRKAVDRLTSEALIEDDRVDVVVGRDGGAPVATALGITVNGVCGVFNVGTVDSHRGRGYGAALTAEILRLGRERGATIASLQSSTMGFTVYERLGFETAYSYIHWAAPR